MGAAAPGEPFPSTSSGRLFAGARARGGPERENERPQKPIARAAGGRAGASVSRRTVIGRGRQFADRAARMSGGRLFPLRRAYDILVRNRLVIALFLALEI